MLPSPAWNYHVRSLSHLTFTLYVQACYGHTEGAAGITGMLLAICSAQQHMGPGLMCLRSINPYVKAAIADWMQKKGREGSPFIPREATVAQAFQQTERPALAGAGVHS